MERWATGAWIDRPLIRTASLLSLAGTVATIAFLFATSRGLLDSWGRPLGTDFSNIWIAGRDALAGEAALTYDFAAHHRAEQAVFGPGVPFYSWHYPPSFLLVAAPLARLPYLAALALWQGASGLAAFLVVRQILPGRDAALAAVGFPAVMVCLTHGHTGFLSAFLFGAGLLALERRPVLAGMWFGLLAYKPQLGLLLPLALAAGGHWRTIATAGLTVAATVALSAALFGLEAWTAFAGSAGRASDAILRDGATGWPPIQTAFAAIRLWGGGVGAAYAAQAVVTLAAAAATVHLWHRPSPFALRAAALLVGSLLATPYAMDYDLTLLGPALAFWAAHALRHGFRRWEASALALAWAAPLIGRSAALHLGLPVGFAALALLFALTVRRAAVPDAAEPARLAAA